MTKSDAKIDNGSFLAKYEATQLTFFEFFQVVGRNECPNSTSQNGTPQLLFVPKNIFFRVFNRLFFKLISGMKKIHRGTAVTVVKVFVRNACPNFPEPMYTSKNKDVFF